MKNNNIEHVTKNNWCMGCGACKSICPFGAINIILDKNKGVYLPQINNAKCRNCGLCKQVCPSINFDIEKNIFKNDYAYFIGQAQDSKIAKLSSSGGGVTNLLIYLLKAKIIDAALVVKNEGVIPKALIVTSEKEILESKGSKYCPIPLCEKIEEIIKSDYKKMAIIALPCEIQAFRNYEKVYPILKNKIVIHIGLFCSRLPTFQATNYLFTNLLKINRNKVKSINYRLGHEAKTILSNGEEKKIKYKKYWNTDFKYLINERCLLCANRINEQADISFGDYWENKQNIIIVRNKKFEAIFNDEKFWKVKKITKQQVVDYLSSSTNFKKKMIKPRIFFYEKILRRITPYNQKNKNLLPSSSIKDFIISGITFLIFFYTKVKHQFHDDEN